MHTRSFTYTTDRYMFSLRYIGFSVFFLFMLPFSYDIIIIDVPLLLYFYKGAAEAITVIITIITTS